MRTTLDNHQKQEEAAPFCEDLIVGSHLTEERKKKQNAITQFIFAHHQEQFR